MRDKLVTGVQTCALPIGAPDASSSVNPLRFTLDDASGALPAIAFQWADAIPDQWLAERLDVAFRLERDEWQGGGGPPARVAGHAAGRGASPDRHGGGGEWYERLVRRGGRFWI